ncbi:MAG: SDR family NAD(P)-dependent oxidoreductase [Deltaproteobacteria bacterium]
MTTNQEFHGLTALVTGSSNGIGAATAVAFAERGAHVLIQYGKGKSEAERVLGKVRESGSGGETLGADLSRAEGVHAFLESIRGRSIDILINNAGSLIQRMKFVDFTEEYWDQVMMLNLTSAMLITKAVVPHMLEKKRGFIVNVSSVAARNGGGIGAMAYASAKAALSAMTKGLAKELAPQGIRVNTVSPGTIETNFHRTFSTSEMLDKVRAATPVQRLGTSEEVADVIVFLCTDGARFIHGQAIEVNGGFLML